ncbi:MAG: acetyl-CoA carboxylase biotin carboxyl carrier protein [Henriciella sp.]
MPASKKETEAELVRALATIMNDADLGEIEVENSDVRIRINKTSSLQPQAMPVVAPTPAPIAAVAAPASEPTSASPAEAAAGNAAAANAIKSPMVGTVYLASEPGAKPFVQVGDKVNAGDTLLLIEAMKTFNPVSAPSAGTVKQICASDGQPVEFGEPLIVVE